MRPGIHPQYRPVVYRDRSADFAFLTRSTATSDKTIEWEDGNAYPSLTTTSRRPVTRSDRQAAAARHRRTRREAPRQVRPVPAVRLPRTAISPGTRRVCDHHLPMQH